MASEALGSAYVLTDEGVAQLAAMARAGGAPSSSEGFTSHYRDSSSTRLSALEELVRHRPRR